MHLIEMPKVDGTIDYKKDEPRWEKLMGLRDEVLRVLENLRQEKKITSNQEASVTIYCEDKEMTKILTEFGLEEFAALCIVSEVKLIKGAGETTVDSTSSPQVVAEKSRYEKCQRCWNYWPSVGKDSEYPDLCERCTSVVREA